ncbi:hypothetical protein D7V90_14235, partial [bacterium 1xD42-87]
PGYGQAGRRKLGPGRDAGDPGRHGRFAAVEGGAYTRPCRAETEDVLFRIPQHLYFRTRYKEMSIILAHSSEIYN